MKKSKNYSAPKAVHQKITEEKSESLDLLRTLIGFPGISADGFQSQALAETADYLLSTCRSYGWKEIEKFQFDDSAPYIFVNLPTKNPKAPTILLYAHYDVQPVGNEHLWRSPPFKATILNQRLYGRGSADDKVGVATILSAIKAFQNSGHPLPVNLKILFDGEEESGSPHMLSYLKKNKKKLKADYLIVPDLINPRTHTPGITFCLRGLIEFSVKISALKKAVHSGLANGVTPDPTACMAKIYGNAIGPNGEVNIPGIKSSKKIPKFIQSQLKNIPFSSKELAKEFNLLPSVPLLKKTPSKYFEALWFSPALTLLHTKIAEKNHHANCVQPEMEAIFSLRVSPLQNIDHVAKALRRYFTQNLPFGCRSQFKIDVKAPGFFTSPEKPFFQKALKAVSSAYPQKALAMGAGLSIPFVHLFQKQFGNLKTILLGVEDPQSHAHSENESVHLPMVEKTTRSLVNLFEVFSRS